MQISRNLLATAICLCVVACGASEGQGGANLEEALARGVEHLAAGRLEKARVEFQNARQIAPESAEALYQSGVVAERLRDYGVAGRFYQAAVDGDPSHSRARADLARAYLFAGAPDRSIEIVAPGLNTAPDDVHLLTVRAAARMALGDIPGAFQDAERAIDLAPDYPRAIALLAGLYDSNARSDRARALLEQGVKAQPRNADLRIALSELYSSLDLQSEAEAQMRELVRLEPENAAHRIRLAQVLARLGKQDAAEQELRAARSTAPKDPQLRRALVDLLVSQGRQDLAEQELRRAIEASPGEWDIHFDLGALYGRNDDPEKAEAVLRAVIAQDPRGPGGLAARSRLAAILSQRGGAEAALRLVEEALAINPRDVDALAIRASLRLARGEAPAAVADLRAVLRDQPDAAGLLRLLAQAHVATGELSLAEDALRRALEAQPRDPPLRVELANVLLAQNRTSQAKQLVEEVVREFPSDQGALAALFRAAVATRDAATARRASDALLAAAPDSPQALFFSGLVAESAGRNDDALKAYVRALEIAPRAVEPARAMTNMLVRTARHSAALERLTAVSKRAPDSAELTQLRGQVLLAAGRYEEAEALYRDAMARQPRGWLFPSGLATALIARGDEAGAVETLRNAVKVVDEPNAIRTELASIASRGGRFDDAIAEYEAILASGKEAGTARQNLAVLLATHRRDPDSLDRAASLVAGLDAGSEPSALVAFAVVARSRGEYAAAIDANQRALQLAPNLVAARYQLGLAQMESGDVDAARQTLQPLVDAGPRGPGYADAKVAIARLARGN